MNLSQLPKLVARKKKRLARGHGSGKVKTAGRGTKGQKARGTIPPGFEGGQLALHKRLPLMRGKGRNKSRQSIAFPVSLSLLDTLPAGTTVTLSVLVKHAVITNDVTRVKVLASGSLTKKLTVKLPCSREAIVQIEKAGGVVDLA